MQISQLYTISSGMPLLDTDMQICVIDVFCTVSSMQYHLSVNDMAL